LYVFCLISHTKVGTKFDPIVLVKEEAFHLAVIKVIEVVGESQKSWDDAVRDAVRQASKSVRNISGVEIYNLTGNVSDGDVIEYKANCKIAFPVDGTD
jgi:flavin-binding protein dodecin